MTPTQRRPPIPTGVYFTLIVLSFFSVLQLLMGFIPGTVITVIFLYYLHRGHPLARQWACMIGFVLFLIGLDSLEVFSGHGPRIPAGSSSLLPLSLVGLPIAIWIGLGVKTSKRFFDLQCHYCQSFKTRPLSFLYNRIECMKCKRNWKFRDPPVETEVFD